MKGPCDSAEDACEAYAATLNREIPLERFLQMLHPDVVFSTKHQHIEGKIPVAFYLATRWNWSTDDPSSTKSVTMPVRTRMADGGVKDYCGLFLVDRRRYWEETHLRLKDGWVNRINVFAPRLSPRYPFPERVRDLAARLRSRTVFQTPN